MTTLLAWCFVTLVVLLIIGPLSFSWLKRREQNWTQKAAHCAAAAPVVSSPCAGGRQLLLRSILARMWQRPVVLEDLSPIPHVNEATAGRASHEMLGFIGRLAAHAFADDLTAPEGSLVLRWLRHRARARRFDSVRCEVRPRCRFQPFWLVSERLLSPPVHRRRLGTRRFSNGTGVGGA